MGNLDNLDMHLDMHLLALETMIENAEIDSIEKEIMEKEIEIIRRFIFDRELLDV